MPGLTPGVFDLLDALGHAGKNRAEILPQILELLAD
jgi:hypothetical protein